MISIIKHTIILLSLPIFLYAQYSYLQVQHPQETWRSGQGTIEQAVFSIHPKGMCTENELTLTFSARGLNFTNSDSIEVQLNFALPDGAVITDLWLWIDSTTISKALILDRWTASTIYESIVKRRRDPAILYQTSSNYYQLRVYPMAGASTRKVKISYLTTSDWTIKSTVSPLPTHIIRASKNPVPLFTVQFWPDGLWNNPWILELPEFAGKAQRDTAGKEYIEFALSSAAVQSSLSIANQIVLQNGVFVQRYAQGNGGIYQIALIPSKAFHLQSGRKVALLFDFDPTKSTTTSSEVLSAIKSVLRENFTSDDSLNLIFSQLNIRRVSEHWFPGDSAGIQSAFDLAGSRPLSSYSNLPPLLANGIDFIQHHGNEGVIWLVSNTDQLGDYQVANPLLSDLTKLMSDPIPIHVTDFNNTNTRYFYINGQSYYGNQYFYENLARLTKGSNTRISSTLYAAATKTLQWLHGSITTFDLYTTLSGGFCYARLTPGLASLQSVSLDQPIIQIGKFSGSFPIIIEAAGNYRDTLFSRRLTISASDAYEVDSVAMQIWAGQYLKTLALQGTSNDIITQIIDVSLKNRVLSNYTAFLALEPNDSLRMCTTCVSGSPGNTPGAGTTGIKTETRKDSTSESLVRVYPNPFNSQTTLQVRLPKGVTNQEVTLRIYNTLGQLIYSFDVSRLDDRHNEQLTWRGISNNNTIVASGIYFAILSTPKGRYTSKLLMLK
ncbi:MAG: T9SS C-terminal target domain-containing protein [Ignavibacteriae bacterium]|nr:MAG: T9SS C-terminal target domain-containing protein [Ignavibacteriota bacterium]